jgi:hypothetical protein
VETHAKFAAAVVTAAKTYVVADVAGAISAHPADVAVKTAAGAVEKSAVDKAQAAVCSVLAEAVDAAAWSAAADKINVAACSVAAHGAVVAQEVVAAGVDAAEVAA